MTTRRTIRSQEDGFYAFLSWFLKTDGTWAAVWVGPHDTLTEAFKYASSKSQKPIEAVNGHNI